jgi:hypothetical protein
MPPQNHVNFNDVTATVADGPASDSLFLFLYIFFAEWWGCACTTCGSDSLEVKRAPWKKKETAT